jgi:seryl-tRNA synthetase
MSNIEKTYDEFIKISKKQKNIYDEFEELNGVVNLMANKIEVLNSQLNVRAQLENEILKLKKIIKRLEVR